MRTSSSLRTWDELRMIALQVARRKVPAKVGTAVLPDWFGGDPPICSWRAKGRCEGCGAPAPFRGVDGQPFLETHHTTRLADDGPDHPRKVIGSVQTAIRGRIWRGFQIFHASLIRNCAGWKARYSELRLRSVRNTRSSQCAMASASMASSASHLTSSSS